MVWPWHFFGVLINVVQILIIGVFVRPRHLFCFVRLFWFIFVLLDNVMRQIIADGPLRVGGVTIIQSTQVGPVAYMLVGLGLMLLMVLRPQGIFGNKKEMALDAR